MHQQKTVVTKLIAIIIVMAMLFGPVAQVRAAFTQQEIDPQGELNLDFWDEPDLSATGVDLHASVGVSGQPFVLYDEGTYHLWYGGDDMMWYTSSTNPGSFPAGVDCTFPAGQEPGFRGAIYIEKVDGTFYMINTGNRKSLLGRTYSNEFALYSSLDGVAWTRHRIVFTHPNVPYLGFFIPTKVNAPHMIKINGVLHLYFQYITGDRTNSIGLATSNGSITDISSLSFTKQPDVLEPSGEQGTFDEESLFHPWVLEKDGVYYMYYSGAATNVGVATSTDGQNWTRVYSNATGFVGGSQQAVVPNNGRWDFWTGSGAIQYTSHGVLPGFTAPTIASNNISGSALTGVPQQIDFTITNPAPQASDTIKGLEIPHAYIRYTIANTDGTALTESVTSRVLVANPADPTATPVELTPMLEDGKLVFDTSGMTDWTITAPLTDGSTYIKPTFSVPGSYTLTATLVDKYGDPDIAMANVSGDVVVEQGNTPPVISPVSDFAIAENELYTFTPTVTDDPNQTLSFTLDPTDLGATVNATTGAFSWTPSESQGGDVYQFTYGVCDNFAPPACASQQFSVTVTEDNHAPELTSIDDKTAAEDTLLSFNATATDPDLPSQTLTFSLTGTPPVGATITPAGAFTWTPTEEQGPGEYTFKVKVCDDGTPVLCDEQDVNVTVNEVNVAPVLANITNRTMDELNNLTVTVTASDADMPAQALSFSLVGEAHGATLNEVTGKFTWTPTEAQGPGTFSFTVKVCDDGSPVLCDEKSFTVTVNEVNKSPILEPIGDKEVEEEQTLTFIATAGDADQPAQSLTFSLTPTTLGAVIDASSGVFTWTPTEEQGPGEYAFTVKVCDNATPALCDQKTFDVIVAEVNVAPVLADIEDQAINELATLELTFSATDADMPAQALSFSLVGEAHGATLNEATGKFTWTPTEAQGPGTFSFTVKVCDNGTPVLCDQKTFEVDVKEVNIYPVLDPIGDKEVYENQELTFTATASDEDIPAQTLTFSLVDAPAGAEIDPVTGVFTWIPTHEQIGVHTLEVCVTDGLAEVCEEITITVKEFIVDIFDITDFGLWGEVWPGALSLGWGYKPEFDITKIASIEVGMLDENDKNIIKYTADLAQVIWQRNNGYITDPGKLSSAPFYVEYNGNPIQEGRDFDWTVIFGEAFADWNPRWGYVKVTTTDGLEEYERIEYLGERPDITPPTVGEMVAIGGDGFDDVTAEDMVFTVPQGYVVEKISITMSEPVTVVDGTEVLFEGQPYGTITVEGNILTVTPYPGNEEAALIGTFTLSVPEGAIKDLVGHPLRTLEATLIVINLAPVAVDDGYTVAEDAVLTVEARGVLANDTDYDPTVLTAVLVDEPSHGTVVLATDGGFVYTPAADFNGTDTFTYKANDGDMDSNIATVTITVTPVNDAPVLEPIADATIPELEAYTFTAVATDVDAGDTLTFSLVGAPAGAAIGGASGVFTWTPTEEQGPGEYTFTVKVCDDAEPALCDEQELKLTVTEVNVAPVLADIADQEVDELDTLTLTFAATDADMPAQALSFSLVGEAHGATLNEVTGEFSWTPTEAQGPGTFSFTVKVCDNGTPVLCDQKTFEVEVEEVNIPPALAEIGDHTVVAGEELTFTATATDEDIPVQNLTFSLKNAPAGATIDGTTGIFTWTPTAAQVGEHSFEVCVTDGVTEVCEEITVTVTESVVVNLPPVAVADAYETNEDVALTIAAPGVLENDSDPNGDAITAVLVTGPEHGTLALAADGGFVYTPNADWNGTDTFTYKASDGTLESEDATVTITVKPVNDAPVAVDDTYSVAEDTLLSISAPGVLANDSDVDGDVLNATVRTNPSHGALTLKGDGSFTYMPDADWNGTDTFTYTLVTHPGTNSEWTDWATVTITVTPVNDAPVLDPIPNATIPEMVAYTFTATATDVDSTNLTFSLVGAPAGAAINASTGVFTWTPTEAQGPQVYTFTVKVCDDATPSLCDQQSVKLTVTEVNRAPEIEDIEDQEVTVGEELTFTAVASDPDLPANTLTFRLEEAPAGAAIDPTTGKFTWTPVESQIGEHEFHVCVTDGQLNDCTLVKVTVLQGHVNTPPVAVADTYAVDQDQVLTIAAPGVLANDTDADNDTLTAILVSTSSKGTLAFKADGSFVYTPQAGFFGTDTFTYKANDGEADSNVVTVTITVRKAEPVMPYGMYYPVIFQGW